MNIIVAVSENGVIGRNGKMPWHLPKDLQYFKRITSNHTVVMGRYTFEAIGKPLPNRKNIVLSSTLPSQEGIWIAKNWNEALNYIQPNEQVFLIGGQQIFDYALQNQFVNKIYRTLIHHVFEGDTFFPQIDTHQWKLIEQTFSPKDEKNPYDLTFEIWERL